MEKLDCWTGYLIPAVGMSYERVKYWFNIGLISDTEWELYKFLWRNGNVRFSDLECAYDLKV